MYRPALIPIFPYLPENLKKIAYSYGWNEQNPLIIGAIAKYLYESGRIIDREYDEPEINNKLLCELEKSAEKKTIQQTAVGLGIGKPVEN